MSDEDWPDAAAEPPSIYVPFPTFVDWYRGGFEPTAFNRYAALFLESKKNATTEAMDAAVNAATRYAAVDTGAIEGLYTVDRGFTRTVATQSAVWEAVLESRGSHVREAFEDALKAYEYVLDAATHSVPIGEAWIRELHAIACASQKTYTVFTAVGPQEHSLEKGTYKTTPNSPTLVDGRLHAYASVSDTGPEMRRLVDELRSEAFQSAHPIVQAAYSHYAYVCIHPFADGNGRVARALASVYLYRSPGVPLVIFADQRESYLDALEASDNGNSFEFIEFIGTRTVDAIGIIRAMLNRSSPSLAQSLKGINELFAPGLDHAELEAAAIQLRDMAAAEMRKQLDQLELPSQLKVVGSANHVAAVSGPDGYSGIGSDGSFYMAIKVSWPRDLQSIKPMAVFIRSKPDGNVEFMVASRADDGLEVWLRELTPVVSETLKLKLTSWIEGKIAEVVADIAEKAAAGRLP